MGPQPAAGRAPFWTSGPPPPPTPPLPPSPHPRPAQHHSTRIATLCTNTRLRPNLSTTRTSTTRGLSSSTTAPPVLPRRLCCSRRPGPHTAMEVGSCFTAESAAERPEYSNFPVSKQQTRENDVEMRLATLVAFAASADANTARLILFYSSAAFFFYILFLKMVDLLPLPQIHPAAMWSICPASHYDVVRVPHPAHMAEKNTSSAENSAKHTTWQNMVIKTRCIDGFVFWEHRENRLRNHTCSTREKKHNLAQGGKKSQPELCQKKTQLRSGSQRLNAKPALS
ncbi:hypothetical protein B0H14DRAFT_2759763 [Mycena olivaceomarginata]|nr:hypothetical protein B0H14DRAFT_2759763 [Mycena olivaceomarginata]